VGGSEAIGVADGAGTGSDVDDLVRCGPFVAGGHAFVIDTNDAELGRLAADRLRDLRMSVAEGPPTVFLVLRRGPQWLSHPWGLWRDGEPCETELANDYVLAYILWEITRLVLEGTGPNVPIHAGAVVLDGRAIVLAGQSHAGKSTLTAWLTWRGWGFLTDEVAILDVESTFGQAVVRPFWRPVGVRRGGPLDAVVTFPSADPEVLIPATELGRLAEPAPLAAFVMPSYTPGDAGGLEPMTAAATLRTLAAHLPTLLDGGRRVFRALSSLLETVPAYSLRVDDLDTAEAQLRQLLEPGVIGASR